MNLQDQHCTLAQAKRLSELGIAQDVAQYYWVEGDDDTPNELLSRAEILKETGSTIIDDIIDKHGKAEYSETGLNEMAEKYFKELLATGVPIYAAFNVAELGVMLPYTIIFNKTQKADLRVVRMNGWSISYQRRSSNRSVIIREAFNEAEARAKALITVHENGWDTAGWCNARLTLHD